MEMENCEIYGNQNNLTESTSSLQNRDTPESRIFWVFPANPLVQIHVRSFS